LALEDCECQGPQEGDVPTYQYACTVCGHQLEAVQSFSDDPLTECPECAGRLRKLFSSVGIVFKGSGFYRTDSRADSNGSAKKDTKDAPAKEAATTTASESAPKKESSTPAPAKSPSAPTAAAA
jgi:putative FmdB family regulatory protein